ncbi:hypothetical protein ACFLUG_05265 [Chloroflexota bacterium]
MKIKLLLSTLIIAVLVLAGCSTDEDSVKPGEEFSLGIGERAAIAGENLEIEFLEVIEDSRCPKDVTCVWEGRARCLVQFRTGDTTEKVELAEPGLSDDGSGQTWNEYRITFSLMPYPESTVETKPGDYRLHLTISK